MKKTKRFKKMFLLLIPFMLAFALSGCGSSSSSPPPSSPPPSSPPATSSSSQSGAMGVAVVNGATDVAAPATGNGVGYLTTLPNTGALIGVTVSSAEFQPISVPAITTAVSGTNLDCAHSIGVAFSYDSPVVAFFSFPSKCAPSTSTLNQVGYYTTVSTNQLHSSAGYGDVGGVVLDSADQWAIASTGDGFQIISYSTPSAPTLVKTIPSYTAATPAGIDMAENFAFDPNFSVSTVTDPMILSGGYSDNSLYGTSYDTNSLELADLKTGIIYKPDASTVTNFNNAVAGFEKANPNDGDSAAYSCNTDQIGVDTSYQVAVLGCEDQSFGVLVNLNAMTFTAPTTTGEDGTYTLPTSAIIVFPTQPIASGFDMDNALIESNTHTVFIGAGGLWGAGDKFMVGVLSNPATKFGFTMVPTSVTMPVTSLSNTANCSYTGCVAITPGITWLGAGDPHANAVYQNASGNAMALWLSTSFQGMAVINLTSVLTAPSAPPAASIWYQGIP